jgi:hypothetical protein
MSRGSFSRSVARAASSGGGKAYGSRSPIGWYLVLTVIVLVGASLVVYSRYENMHRTSKPTAAAVAPTASDHWQMAYAIDICGKLQSPLAANSNLATVGIRTFGNGLIDINPGAVTTVANRAKYEGAKATLGLFASSYPGFKLTADSITLPAAKSTAWTTGVDCPGAKSPVGHLEAKVWTSPTATGKLLTTSIPDLNLRNGAMVTIAFVPLGTSIPEPPSKPALIAALGTSK